MKKVILIIFMMACMAIVAMAEEKKAEMAAPAQLIVNSSLCWQQ